MDESLPSSSSRLAVRHWMCGSAILAGALACASPGFVQTSQTYQDAFFDGRLVDAEHEIDALIAAEQGWPAPGSAAAVAAGATLEPDRGDTCLYLLEKAMVRLCDRDLAGARDLLRSARDPLWRRGARDFTDYVSSALLDDAAASYEAADYEQLLVPILLSICDLVAGEGDAYAYALQVGEKQEELIGSSFGEKEGFKPRESYRRIALGAYLQGIVKEAELEPDEAQKAFARARDYALDSHVVEAACARIRERDMPLEGTGVLHIYYLGGRGPSLMEAASPASDTSIRLAGLGIAALTKTVSPVIVFPLVVPHVVTWDFLVRPLEIRVDGGPVAATTETLLDVNAVAEEQCRARHAYVVSRAIVRRSLKAFAAGLVEKGSNALVGGAALATMLASERADTRSWSLIPAEIQVARLVLAEGPHDVALGEGCVAPVHVQRGRATHLLVVRPAIEGPMVVLGASAGPELRQPTGTAP